MRCSARRGRAAATISIARVILPTFLTEAMRLLTSLGVAIPSGGGACLLRLGRGRGLGLVRPTIRAVAAGAARCGALLLRVDPVGLALLERVAVLVEVGTEVVEEVLDGLAQLLLVLIGQLAAVVDSLDQLLVLGAQSLEHAL